MATRARRSSAKENIVGPPTNSVNSSAKATTKKAIGRPKKITPKTRKMGINVQNMPEDGVLAEAQDPNASDESVEIPNGLSNGEPRASGASAMLPNTTSNMTGAVGVDHLQAMAPVAPQPTVILPPTPSIPTPLAPVPTATTCSRPAPRMLHCTKTTKSPANTTPSHINEAGPPSSTATAPATRSAQLPPQSKSTASPTDATTVPGSSTLNPGKSPAGPPIQLTAAASTITNQTDTTHHPAIPEPRVVVDPTVVYIDEAESGPSLMTRYMALEMAYQSVIEANTRLRREAAENAETIRTLEAALVQVQAQPSNIAGPSNALGNAPDNSGTNPNTNTVPAAPIPHPKGGESRRFDLQRAMGLATWRTRYNALRRAIPGIITPLGITSGMLYKNIPGDTLRLAYKAAREAQPFLAAFENNWATDEMIYRWLADQRRYSAKLAKSPEGSGNAEGSAQASNTRGKGKSKAVVPDDDDETADGVPKDRDDHDDTPMDDIDADIDF
ncbi:hypothetical protein FRB99_002707 [Tulasnella sp. 403]|nr:hypothetical protein FRB99_002707 [Tulasnella sp. 403]